MPTNKEHLNINDIGAGQVSSISTYINDVMEKMAAQTPTLLLVAGEVLVFGNPFYIGVDGKAWKCANTSPCYGIWQSPYTAANAVGLGQVAGVMQGAWSWTCGAAVYVNAGGLSHAGLGVLVGIATASNEVLISPHRAHVADVNQSAVTLGNTNNEIGGLTIGSTYSQTQVAELRDKCEELAADVRALSVLVHAMRTALMSQGIIKGGA